MNWEKWLQVIQDSLYGQGLKVAHLWFLSSLSIKLPLKEIHNTEAAAQTEISVCGSSMCVLLLKPRIPYVCHP
jgi:hypothetical protein